jgi:uroporphyrinogen-III synthase
MSRDSFLKTVVVTRPAAQSQDLCHALHQAGFDPLIFPTIEIKREDFSAPHQIEDLKKTLQADIWIFLSENAVIHGLALFQENKIPLNLRPKIAAIGDKTAKILQEQGLHVDIISTLPYSSEKLLEAPDLQFVKHQRIIIFCAPGGRTLLSETLQERGAMVESVFVYRRVCPKQDITELLERLVVKTIFAVIVTSVSSLENLQILLGKNAQLLQTVPIVVASTRIADYAKKQALTQVWVAANVDEKSVVACLLNEGVS